MTQIKNGYSQKNIMVKRINVGIGLVAKRRNVENVIKLMKSRNTTGFVD